MKLLNAIKEIITGFFFEGLYRLGLITDPKILSVVGQRKVACNSCPLRDGKWCSKKKFIQINTGNKVMTDFGFEVDEYKIIKGCGCYLESKWWTASKCPLDKWESFQ